MGRPSKLTDRQWDAIRARHIEGESFRKLAKEFGVSESTIRERISAQSAQVKTVANQIVATERALKSLPISAQIAAHSLADKLRSISAHLASSAEFGSAISNRLNGIAHDHMQKVDDAAPLEKSAETLKGIAVLTKMANDSAQLGLNLLKANEEMIREANGGGQSNEDVLRELVDSLPD